LIILGPILSIPLIIRFISLASKAQNGFVVPVMLYTNACNISLGIGVQCLTTRNFKLSEQLITLWIPNLLMITSIFWYIAQKRKVQKKCGIFLCIIYTIIVLCNVAMRRPIR
jgi:Ca2+/Na+ antiporter